jgi:hypothetical protein
LKKNIKKDARAELHFPVGETNSNTVLLRQYETLQNKLGLLGFEKLLMSFIAWTSLASQQLIVARNFENTASVVGS